MNADTATLSELLAKPYQYVIPIFQRYYSWEESDWKQLWSDLNDLWLNEDEEDVQPHFMGSLVLDSPKQTSLTKPAFNVIDGQQRLTTFSLLMCALRNVAKERGYEKLCKAVENTALIDQDEEGRYRFRVYPRQRDRENYFAAIEGDGAGADGAIGEALHFFFDRIENLENAETEEQLRRFFNLLRLRLQFVHIILGEKDNSYQIFSSLNSTGRPLSEADLVRNFVFMQVTLEDQERFDDELWKPIERRFTNEKDGLNVGALSGFLRNFLMRTGRYVKPAATFHEFERRYSGAGFDPEDLAIELGWYADYYDVIRGTKTHDSPSVEAALSKLRGLQATTTYPLLLNLLHHREEGRISEEELVRCVEMISGFILRRYVCGLSSRGYSRWFVSVNRELGNQPAEGLRSFLSNNKEFPEDETFRKAFVRFNLYQSDYGRYALEMLERAHGHKEPPDLAKAQIEHIMPQTLTNEWKADLGPEHERIHSDWLHTLGNLTLSAYNPELYNHRFSVKRQEYERSNVTITRQLASHTSWGEGEIRDRAADLAELAAKMWTGPHT